MIEIVDGFLRDQLSHSFYVVRWIKFVLSHIKRDS